jgi:hypothetical protein
MAQDKATRIYWDGFPTSEEIIREIRKETDTVLLAFSAGKDSIAAWLAIREHFKVIPFYRYSIPGLGFVERSLKYYEEFFGTHIIRIQHPSLTRWLNNFVFTPPERCGVIEELDFPEFNYDDQRDILCEDLKLPPNQRWIANGTRATDSLQRRTHFKCHGAINRNGRVFYPIWDWNSEGMMQEFKRSGVAMPVDYQLFGRSFDGIDFRFLNPIKDHFPEDYATILKWFPLAELEIKRFEYAQAHRKARN